MSHPIQLDFFLEALRELEERFFKIWHEIENNPSVFTEASKLLSEIEQELQALLDCLTDQIQTIPAPIQQALTKMEKRFQQKYQEVQEQLIASGVLEKERLSLKAQALYANYGNSE